MINYLLLAFLLMVGFAIIQLIQYVYITHLVDQKDDEEIKRVAFWGKVVSSIMIGVGVLIILVVLLTRRYAYKEGVAAKRTIAKAAVAAKKAAQAPAAAPVRAPAPARVQAPVAAPAPAPAQGPMAVQVPGQQYVRQRPRFKPSYQYQQMY